MRRYVSFLLILTFIFVLIGTALFSIVTALTAENSLIVFAVMLIITILSAFVFLFDKR